MVPVRQLSFRFSSGCSIPATGAGHRTFVGRQIFRQFVVELTDSIKISARRDGDKLVGTYRMSIELKDGKEIILDWVAGPEGSIKEAKQGPVEEANFMKYLAGLNLGLH